MLSLLRPCLAAETVWFGGTQRALPISLAAPKEDGLRSAWSFTDAGDTTWDFHLGPDVSIWQRTSESCFQSIGARFGVTSRFEFGSESFDLWAADFRGGGGWGIRLDRMAYEVFLFHESSHLGDELLERQERARIDYGVNGIRLMASQRWNLWLRTYAGVTGQPLADPEELQSLGFHAGIEFTKLPPFHRGYVAVDAEDWEWRDWAPDVTAQTGLFIGPRGKGVALESARCFVEFRHGRVMLGQFYNETENYVAVGLAMNW